MFEAILQISCPRAIARQTGLLTAQFAAKLLRAIMGRRSLSLKIVPYPLMGVTHYNS